MKKILYLGFCLVLLAGFGCAITDYGVISDNSQYNGANSGTTNTKGKAHIRETSQVATIWPDGNDELINFVDQSGDGTAVLTTYNNFSSGGDPTFHDDLYCNTGWNGCSIFTAPDNNDGDLFDGTFNANCSGARSLSILLSTGRYYGECGRAGNLSIDEKGQLLSAATKRNMYGAEFLYWRIDSSRMNISMSDKDGNMVNIPLRGSTGIAWDPVTKRSVLRMDNALLSHDLRFLRNFLQESAGAQTTVQVEYNGVSTTFTTAGSHQLVLENLAHNQARL